MDFKSATDQLIQAVSLDSLAEALGVSVPTVKQARLSDVKSIRRAPTDDWRPVVIRLAEKQVRHYQKLMKALQTDESNIDRSSG